MLFEHLAGPLQATAHVPAHAAADASADHPVFHAMRDCRIRKVTIIPGAAISGADTNSANLNLKSWTAAGVATERANVDYASGTDEVAMVANELYEPSTPLSLDAGQNLTLEREKVGTGLATPALQVVVEYDFSH